MPINPVVSIIDDDKSVRESTRDLVDSLGCVAVTFESAEEFLRSDHRRNTACVISDVRMPGMSGIDLQRRLIANGDCPPIIFITSFSDESSRARALKAGALCYLKKPFNDDSLIECLNRALSGVEKFSKH